MRIRRTLGAVALTGALITATATAANAASGYERYNCTYVNYDGITYSYRCNGSWYAGTPNSRTFQSVVDVTYNSSNHFRTNSVKSVTSTDGRKKYIKWYCRYSNGTVGSVLAVTQVGGGRSNTYTWPSGYHPCEGTDVGLAADVLADYGGKTYKTIIDWNSTTSGYGQHYAHPWTTA